MQHPAGLQPRHGRHRGLTTATRAARFSLLELLIVLALMATVMALVLPRLGGVPLGLRVSQAVDAINSSFHAAASLAMATGQPVKLTIDLERGMIDVEATRPRRFFADHDSDEAHAGMLMDQLRQFELPEDLELDDAAFGYTYEPDGYTYDFYPDGEAVGPLTAFRIASRRFTLDVDRLTARPILDEYE